MIRRSKSELELPVVVLYVIVILSSPDPKPLVPKPPKPIPNHPIFWDLCKLKNSGQCRDDAILPGVRLGVIVLDTCDNPLYTAEQSLDLLQGFMYRKVKNIHKDVVCTKDSIKNILGIIGAQTSEVRYKRPGSCAILNLKSEGFS